MGERVLIVVIGAILVLGLLTYIIMGLGVKFPF